MFQLWKFVLLCGLLSGASASPLAALIQDETNIAKTVNTVLDGEYEVVENVLGTAQQTVRSELKVIQDSEVLEVTKVIVEKAGESVDSASSNLFPAAAKALGMKLGQLKLLDVNIELNPEGEGINMKFPIKTDVSLALPLIGKLVNLKVGLDLMLPVRIETDSETGALKLVKGKCITDPLSLQITLLNRPNSLINKFLKGVTDLVQNAVSFVVGGLVCPVLDIVFQALTVDKVQELMGQLQQNAQKNIPL